VLAFALYPSLGVQGLALAWTFAYVIAAVVSLLWLRRRLGSLEGRRNASAFARVAAAAVAATAVAWVVGAVIGDATASQAIVACVVAITAAAAVYLIGLRLSGVPELAMLRDAARRRRPTTAPGVPDATSADA
jgi:putative peptidoglycan lipid II flippase